MGVQFLPENFCFLLFLGSKCNLLLLLLKQTKLLVSFHPQIQSQVFQNTSHNTVKKG